MAGFMGFNPFMFGNPSSVGQQTAVGQNIIMGARTSGARGGRKSAARRKKKAAGKRAASRMSRTKRRSGKPARLVKGSAAAKAYMAKIRRKRR